MTRSPAHRLLATAVLATAISGTSNALPRNGVGRVMKHKLREVGNTPATWDFDAMALTVAKQERR